ncbi:MAG: DEAD/DEAH box helicase, partial [Campylobacteraceae bacterium]|nr:DEAD/DEAH box helicase [Campylobacteraceae bacterium]
MPPILKGQDVVVSAQTGTGKTAAFMIATLHHLLNKEKKQRDKNNP